MKIKLIQIKNSNLNQSQPESSKDNQTLIYEVPKNKYNTEEIINIKLYLANLLNSSMEKFLIKTNPNIDQEKVFDYGLEDSTKFINFFIENENNNFIKNLKNIFVENSPILYYKEHINCEYISVELDYNMNNINKIKLEVLSTCSVYILKEKIMQNKELKIEKRSEIILMINEINLDDNEIISEIYKDNSNKINDNQRGNSNRSNNNQNFNSFGNENDADFAKKVLKMKIIKKGKKKFSIGINLNFNSLKNISKIKYCEEAPNYREAKDGLNLLCYCRNEECEINDEMFVINQGKK